MTTLNALAQQHILESEARLLHIDEHMARSRQGSTKAFDILLEHAQVHWIEADRDRLARELESLRVMSLTDTPEVVGRVKGLSSALETVGLELKKALAAVLETGHQ